MRKRRTFSSVVEVTKPRREGEGERREQRAES